MFFGNTYINRRPGTSEDSKTLSNVQWDSRHFCIRYVSLPKEKSEGNESPIIPSPRTAEQGASPKEETNADNLSRVKTLQGTSSKKRTTQITEVKHLNLC